MTQKSGDTFLEEKSKDAKSYIKLGCILLIAALAIFFRFIFPYDDFLLLRSGNKTPGALESYEEEHADEGGGVIYNSSYLYVVKGKKYEISHSSLSQPNDIAEVKYLSTNPSVAVVDGGTREWLFMRVIYPFFLLTLIPGFIVYQGVRIVYAIKFGKRWLLYESKR